MWILGQAGAVVLADGVGYHHSTEWGWVMMVGWWLVVIIGVAIVVRMTSQGGRRAGSETSDAESILAQRFASGEIDADEYRDRRSTLRP